MKKICICGGGAQAHVCAAVISSQEDTEVRILTRKPEQWSHDVKATDSEGKVFTGRLCTVTSDAAMAVTDSDIVLLCLPGYAIESMLERIKPYIGNAITGSIVCSTGFFFAAHRILGTEARLFGFQRTPFIARVKEYGKCANLLGYKSQIAIATENVEDAASFREMVERLWITPTKLLASHYEVSLTNSNPILHTGRLYSMWKDWDGTPYEHSILFYREWTEEASRTLLAMDEEFMRLLDVLPVTKGAIPSLLEYYESHDAESLARKIRSIVAFQNILAPMKETADGWMPDFGSRYFTEDFPYGLRLIVALAREKGIDTPVMQKVLDWGMSVIKK